MKKTLMILAAIVLLCLTACQSEAKNDAPVATPTQAVEQEATATPGPTNTPTPEPTSTPTPTPTPTPEPTSTPTPTPTPLPTNTPTPTPAELKVEYEKLEDGSGYCAVLSGHAKNQMVTVEEKYDGKKVKEVLMDGLVHYYGSGAVVLPDTIKKISKTDNQSQMGFLTFIYMGCNNDWSSVEKCSMYYHLICYDEDATRKDLDFSYSKNDEGNGYCLANIENNWEGSTSHYNDILIIPSSYKGLPVTEISQFPWGIAPCFYIPDSVTKIGGFSPDDEAPEYDVFFEGTKAEFEAIEKTNWSGSFEEGWYSEYVSVYVYCLGEE